MKTHFPFCKGFIMAAALTSIMGLSSCLDDDDENYYNINYPNALVTVKSDANDSFFLQLDDKDNTATGKSRIFSLWR